MVEKYISVVAAIEEKEEMLKNARLTLFNLERRTESEKEKISRKTKVAKERNETLKVLMQRLKDLENADNLTDEVEQEIQNKTTKLNEKQYQNALKISQLEETIGQSEIEVSLYRKRVETLESELERYQKEQDNLSDTVGDQPNIKKVSKDEIAKDVVKIESDIITAVCGICFLPKSDFYTHNFSPSTKACHRGYCMDCVHELAQRDFNVCPHCRGILEDGENGEKCWVLVRLG